MVKPFTVPEFAFEANATLENGEHTVLVLYAVMTVEVEREHGEFRE
jgi:hypothetical protein